MDLVFVFWFMTALHHTANIPGTDNSMSLKPLHFYCEGWFVSSIKTGAITPDITRLKYRRKTDHILQMTTLCTWTIGFSLQEKTPMQPKRAAFAHCNKPASEPNAVLLYRGGDLCRNLAGLLSQATLTGEAGMTANEGWTPSCCSLWTEHFICLCCCHSWIYHLPARLVISDCDLSCR